jgi:hypothetical protein
MWKVAGRVVFEFLPRLAQRQHERIGAVGRRNSSFPRLLFRLELHPTVGIELIELGAKLPDGGLIRKPFDLVALQGIGQRLVIARS